MTESDKVNQVKSLAAAVSTQSRVANRLWLVVAVVALLFLIPHAKEEEPSRPNASVGTGAAAPQAEADDTPRPDGAKEFRQLPFGFGEVDRADFAVIGSLMLSILLIAFCQAHAQTVRVTILSHRALKRLGRNDVIPGVKARDFFDALRDPALTRVAPLAQLARGRHQFLSATRRCPSKKKFFTSMYYCLLKIVATLIYLGVPALGSFVAFDELASVSWESSLPSPVIWFTYSAYFVAAIALLQVLAGEVHYVLRVFRVINR